MRLLSSAAVLAVALSSSAAMAGDAAPPALKQSLVRGTVDSFDGKTLGVKTDAGAVVLLPASGMTHYAVAVKKSFSQLKPGDFIGVTAVPGKDGHLQAEEIHTVPLRGLGEGQYPWDHHPAGVAPSAVMGIMTGGMVTAIHAAPMASTGGAWELKVTYHGAAIVGGKCSGLAMPDGPGCTGTSIIDVAPTIPTIAIVPASHDNVQPGLAVVAGILSDGAGHRFLTSATVEKNGVKPEF